MGRSHAVSVPGFVDHQFGFTAEGDFPTAFSFLSGTAGFVFWQLKGWD
jgi:hypothetical protein